MRTTVDLDPSMIERAKRLALDQRRTLSTVVGEALNAYLARQRESDTDPPFELLVRGNPDARFPKPAEVSAIEEEEDIAALKMPRPGRGHAAS